MSYLTFRIDEQASAGKKTKVWAIVNSVGVLGYVHWFSHWRKYTFAPVQGTEWDEVCLDEVAQFCRVATLNHRNGQEGW